MSRKVCSKCGVERHVLEFALHYGDPRAQCRHCTREYNQRAYTSKKALKYATATSH